MVLLEMPFRMVLVKMPSGIPNGDFSRLKPPSPDFLLSDESLPYLSDEPLPYRTSQLPPLFGTAATQVKIIAEDESRTGTTEVGELCVRSPSLFKEYWKQPKITEESFIDGGFFKTGDTVTVDEDGYYIILGRSNADIMKVGGYKLSALDIEAVLLENEVVSECCVLGLPDKDYGEVVCAIIVPQADAKRRSEQELKPAIGLDELQNWSKDKLAPYKIPTKLFLWDSLPRNAMGKVNKKELNKLLGGQ